jgi:hypothetical protein
MVPVFTTSSTRPNLSNTYWSMIVEVAPGGSYGVEAAVQTSNSSPSSTCQGYSSPVATKNPFIRDEIFLARLFNRPWGMSHDMSQMK